MKELPFELKRMLDALGAKENVPMAQYTSFKTGGSVRILAEPDTAEHTAELMRLIEAAGVEHYVIGNGTNLLISDKGLDAIVVRIGEKMANVERSGCTIIAGAGASYAAMAKQSVQWGLMGLEWAAGIPGTVGGAVAMNAGAYGGETADALKTVTYAENGAIIKETVDKTAFGYRLSPYCAPERIVIEAEFELNDDDGSAYERMTDYNKRRREKQPINYPSAGSVFKRPEGHFAGALIEQAGLKGTRIGGAEVSTLHAGLKKSAFIYCAAVSAAMSSVRVVALLSKYIMVSLPFRSIGGRLCAPPYIHNMSYARAWTKRIYINNTTDIQLSPQFNII